MSASPLCMAFRQAESQTLAARSLEELFFGSCVLSGFLLEQGFVVDKWLHCNQKGVWTNHPPWFCPTPWYINCGDLNKTRGITGLIGRTPQPADRPVDRYRTINSSTAFFPSAGFGFPLTRCAFENTHDKMRQEQRICIPWRGLGCIEHQHIHGTNLPAVWFA